MSSQLAQQTTVAHSLKCRFGADMQSEHSPVGVDRIALTCKCKLVTFILSKFFVISDFLEQVICR